MLTESMPMLFALIFLSIFHKKQQNPLMVKKYLQKKATRNLAAVLGEYFSRNSIILYKKFWR